VNFEVSGYRYVKVNRCGKIISIYDLNHSLVKNISMANMPTSPPYNILGDVLYLSEQLFNLDSKVEFIYCHSFTNSQGNGDYVTSVYDENGTMLFTDTAWPGIRLNFEQQQLPIYNTSQGTKLILSCLNGTAKVYGLAGTLSTSIGSQNQELLIQSNFVSNPYPNPTASTTRIDYILPKGVSTGEMIFYDLQGHEIKRYKVDSTFDHLLISTSDIPAGTYNYQLETDSKSTSGKKLVVIK